jgi:hypothetical protein
MIDEPGSFSGSESSPEPRARSRAQKPDVVGDLEQRRRHRIDRPVAHHHSVVGGQRFEFVRCRSEGQAGNRRNFIGDGLSESHRRVQSGAHRSAALGKLHQHRQRLFDAGDAVFDLLGVAGKFLAQRQRCGVLGVGAPDLDDGSPGLGFVVERIAQLLQRRDQPVHDLFRRRDMHRRGIGIVRRLAHVDVIVGMDRLFRAQLAAEHLDRAVRNHLVGVHVGLRARAGLPHDEGEMVVKLAFQHLLRRRHNRFADRRVELAEVHIGFGRGALDDAERPDNRRRLLLPADLEIVARAFGLGAPIAGRVHVDGTEGIGLGASLDHGKLIASS